MKSFNLKPPVAILGFGVEGRAALQWLHTQGIYTVTVCDEKETLFLPAGVLKRLGKDAFSDLSAFQTILRSPGVRFSLPEVQRAVKEGRVVTSMTKLTLEAAADRLTAITGSNGKTTTTALVAALLKAHYGDKLIVGGNDRAPILKEAAEHPADPVLMEVSSFQFMDAAESPHISAILNISPNHMDWHASMEEYAGAKGNLLKFQKKTDWAILNANDPGSVGAQKWGRGQRFWIGKEKGRSWAKWKNGWLTVRHGGKTTRLLGKNGLKVKTHPDNPLFAAAVAFLHGVPPSLIRQEMARFPGVPQRLEHVCTVHEVHFYNDSSCTTPESVAVALEVFDPKRLILMLGGSSKNADFNPLARQITQKKVRVYLYGLEGVRIKEALEKAGGSPLILKHDTSGDFRQIVHDVHQKARPGDSVVLSPACASFDMFQNSKDRGEQFKILTNSLR